MTSSQAGFSLLEGLLALALGLMLLAGASQVFVATVQAWRLQGALAQQQEDARLALQRIAQDIRMTGVVGCLRLHASDFDSPSAVAAFARPVQISQGGAQLSLLVGQLPGSGSRPDWTVLSDCRSWAQVRADAHEGDQQTLALPVSRITYELRDGSLRVMRRGSPQALIDNVRSLRANLVTSPQGQRIDLQLTLFDPQHDLEQQYAISVALRNRLPAQ